MLITIYPPRKVRARRIAEAFAAGCGGRVCEGAAALAPGLPVFYGVMPSTFHLWAQVRRERRPFVWIDNGYWPHWPVRKGSYAVTQDAFQWIGEPTPPNPDRLARMGITLAPWRRGGRSIVIALQSDYFFTTLAGVSRHAWLEEVRQRLREATDRPMIIWEKPTEERPRPTLAEVLADCHALVTHSSKAAVAALCAGVPVFATAPCAAGPMSGGELTRIETPHYPEGREAWAATLAARQWTLEEMRSGQCWRAMQDREAVAA
jgi:hypothetical protein